MKKNLNHNIQNYVVTVVKLAIANKTIAIAAIGILSSLIFTTITNSKPEVRYEPFQKPALSPYDKYIAGIGIVEASSRNLNLNTYKAGIISEVLVEEGDNVKKGQVILKLDQRIDSANLDKQITAYHQVENDLKLIEIELSESKKHLERMQRLVKRGIENDVELETRQFNFQKAEVKKRIAEDKLAEAKSSLKLAEIDVENTELTAPIDSKVLKIRLNVGEFTSGAEQESYSPVLVGKTDPLYLRVQIDEYDIMRFNQNALATAFFAGDDELTFPLKFIRLEPIADSKINIKGQGRELIDTRILEAIYRMEGSVDRLYIGQQLDVFIESGK